MWFRRFIRVSARMWRRMTRGRQDVKRVLFVAARLEEQAEMLEDASLSFRRDDSVRLFGTAAGLRAFAKIVTECAERA